MTDEPYDLPSECRTYPAVTSLTLAEQSRVRHAATGRDLLVSEKIAYVIAAKSPFWSDEQVDNAVDETLNELHVPQDLRGVVTDAALKLLNGWQDNAIAALACWDPPGRAN